MAVSDNDYKLLWGRAAGVCSNPACNEDLTIILEGGGFNVGEMAHIIARSESGPRGHLGGGPDTYTNLILLCPTCHRTVDTAPSGQFTDETLRKWKIDHEAEIRGRGRALKFESFGALKMVVSRKLAENKQLWKTLGPHSEAAENDPGSNLINVWDLRKLDTIIPNNNFIINYIKNNENLLQESAYHAFVKFKNHALAFECNQYGRIDQYPLFPAEFEKEFGYV